METQLKKENHSKFSLSKKGVISFVFSKFTLIIFAVLAASALFFVLVIEKDIQKSDSLAKEAEGIANDIDMVSASRFEVWTVYKSESNNTISFGKQNITLYHDLHNITKGLLFPINASVSDKNISVECLNISKSTSGTVIKKCQ